MKPVFLLDINVLIAIADSKSNQRDHFLDWYKKHDFPGVATCPISENGFLRIFGHPEYPSGPGSVFEASKFLLGLKIRPDYTFVSDTYSLLEVEDLVKNRLITSKTLTDFYLAGLCKKHNIRFATFDRKMTVTHPEFKEVVEVIP